MRLLITGGAGYIGSHAVRAALEQGHEVWILDDLSTGRMKAVHPNAKFILGCVGDYALVAKTLRDFKIEAVMHLAAFSSVAESVREPQKYYLNNFSNGLQLLKAMIDCGVKKLVFSSTGSVYGESEGLPLKEEYTLKPINPYGRSKAMLEAAIADYSKSYGLGYVVLRYFNVAGAHPDGSMGEYHPSTRLIPNVLAAADRPSAHIKIYGTDYATADGTCVRDFVHVQDVVRAHLLAIQSIHPGSGNIFNLGSERGFSVRQVIESCERVTKSKIEVREEPRRGGDPAALIADSRKVRHLLQWQPQYPDIETMVTHAWAWHAKQSTELVRE